MGVNFCGYKINEYRMKIRDKGKRKLKRKIKIIGMNQNFTIATIELIEVAITTMMALRIQHLIVTTTIRLTATTISVFA